MRRVLSGAISGEMTGAMPVQGVAPQGRAMVALRVIPPRCSRCLCGAADEGSRCSSASGARGLFLRWNHGAWTDRSRLRRRRLFQRFGLLLALLLQLSLTLFELVIWFRHIGLSRGDTVDDNPDLHRRGVRRDREIQAEENAADTIRVANRPVKAGATGGHRACRGRLGARRSGLRAGLAPRGLGRNRPGNPAQPPFDRVAVGVTGHRATRYLALRREVGQYGANRWQ